MADAAKKKAMAKLFKSKKKKTSSKKKAEAEAYVVRCYVSPSLLNSHFCSSPIVDESPWETVANETPKETTSKPTKKSLHVGEYECVSSSEMTVATHAQQFCLRSASAEPTGPHIAQVIDAEEAT